MEQFCQENPVQNPGGKKNAFSVEYFLMSFLPTLSMFGMQLLMAIVAIVLVLVSQMLFYSGNRMENDTWDVDLVSGVTPMVTLLAHFCCMIFFFLWHRLRFPRPRATPHKDCASDAPSDFLSDCAMTTQEYFVYSKEEWCKMTENMQADDVQSRQAVFVGCCPKPKWRERVQYVNWKVVLLCFGIGFVVLCLSNGIVMVETLLFPFIVESVNAMMELSGFGDSVSPLMYVAAIVFAPIGEEFCYRGLTLYYAKKGVGKFWIANLMQAALFGLIHMNLVQGAYAFVMGLVLGWLVERYQSVLPSILAHFAMNGISMFCSRFLFDWLPVTWTVAIPLLLVPTAVVVGGVWWLEKKRPVR